MIELALLLAALSLARPLRPDLFSFLIWDRLAAAVDRLPRALRAAAVGLACFGLAALYVRPGTEPVALGKFYVLLASHPFDTAGNSVGYRILTPLLSWLVGLRGDGLIVTNWILAAVFLALVWRYFARRAPRPGDALFAAAVLALSLVTLTTVYYGGYCDSLSYILLLGMWWARARRPLFYLFFLLGLLNRESVAFLVPWFAYLTWRERRPAWRAALDLVLGFGLSLALYFGYREWMAQGGEIKYGVGYYLEPLARDPFFWVRKSVGYWWLGLFTVFKLMWALPAAVAIAAWREGDREPARSMAILLVCGFVQLLVAFDSSRMLTLVFLVQVMALERLFAAHGEAARDAAHRLWLANLLVPQLFTAGIVVEQMHSPLAARLLAWMGARG